MEIPTKQVTDNLPMDLSVNGISNHSFSNFFYGNESVPPRKRKPSLIPLNKIKEKPKILRDSSQHLNKKQRLEDVVNRMIKGGTPQQDSSMESHLNADSTQCSAIDLSTDRTPEEDSSKDTPKTECKKEEIEKDAEDNEDDIIRQRRARAIQQLCLAQDPQALAMQQWMFLHALNYPLRSEILPPFNYFPMLPYQNAYVQSLQTPQGPVSEISSLTRGRRAQSLPIPPSPPENEAASDGSIRSNSEVEGTRRRSRLTGRFIRQGTGASPEVLRKIKQKLLNKMHRKETLILK